jgi:hypothetical protein
MSLVTGDTVTNRPGSQIGIIFIQKKEERNVPEPQHWSILKP